MSARIGHIILNVSNFEISEVFYDRLLLSIGFHSDYRELDENGASKSYRLNEHNLWIRWDAKSEHRSFVRDVGLDHLAFFVDSEKEVNQLFNELSLYGAIITRFPAHYPEYSETYYAFYFRDPDRIPLEVAIA